ncbi:hypothetical protein ALC57_09941, partial [Trachymyrmex cornetzi]
LRWVLGVERGTPGYMVREELQREKLRVKAGKRAWAFEEKLKGGGGGELARLCWKRENMRREENLEGRMGERGQFFGDRVVKLEKWQREELDRERVWDELWERDEKMWVTKYNRLYGWVKEEGVPEYLSKGWGERRWRRVTRFRLRNEVRKGRYWEGEEERKCRLCGNGVETWEHVWEGCRVWREWHPVGHDLIGHEPLTALETTKLQAPVAVIGGVQSSRDQLESPRLEDRGSRRVAGCGRENFMGKKGRVDKGGREEKEGERGNKRRRE